MDDELKLVERLRQKAIDLRLGDYYRSGGVGKPAVVADEKARILDEAAAAITRLHAEIDALIDRAETAEADFATATNCLSDMTALKIEAEAQRDAALEALRPFANAYAVLKRRGYLVAPNGTALMYDPQDPKFLGPFVDDLARAHRTLEAVELILRDTLFVRHGYDNGEPMQDVGGIGDAADAILAMLSAAPKVTT